MKICIKDGQVWGKSGFSTRDIYIDSGVICSRIKERKDIIEEEYQVIDATGRWVIPGLINAHCHLVLNASPNAMIDIYNISEEDSMIHCYNNAKKMLYSGVTTIRDCGSLGFNILKLKCYFNKNKGTGPKLLSCGKALKKVKGHSFGEEVHSAQEMNCICNDYIQKGIDFIKLMASGGLIDDPQDIGLGKKEIEVAVNVAKENGLKVAAHAHSKEGILNAIKSCVSTIEHGTMLDNELIELMIKNNVTLIPTFSPYIVIANEGIKFGFPKRFIESAKNILELKYKSFENAYRQGVRIAFGTDAGAPFVLHDDFLTEMHSMMHAGMSTEAIICSATDNAALALGLENEVGDICVGKNGDIIVLNANPLKELAAYNDIELIIHEGEIISKKGHYERIVNV